MTGLLVAPRFLARHGDAISRIERATGVELERIVLPEAPDARVGAEAIARIEIANFSGDVFPDRSPAFFSAVFKARNLRWFHSFTAGTDHDAFQQLVNRGVVLTNASGARAVPIAQTAITGLLMLARGFPHWLDAQRRRAWEEQTVPPRLLGEQTLVVLGLGAIGSEIARLGRALGLRVIGVRRAPARPGDPVDALVTPAELDSVLPRADFLAIACPLTEQTRGMISAERLALLPRGARLLNVGRGAIVDEPALIAGLERGELGGAYLDVFAVEPLPEDSPLWSLPNVIVTPHNSAAASGNAEAEAPYFLRNLEHWLRKEELENRVG